MFLEESESFADALAVFSGASAHVVYDTWFEFVYALVEVSDVPPKIFRASHPLICRSGEQVGVPSCRAFLYINVLRL